MTIYKMVQEIHENAMIHGWWEQKRSFGELIALCHSELSEALEEYRNGYNPIETRKSASACKVYAPELVECKNCRYLKECETERKPLGIPSELADCVIRIMDICGYYGIDLEAAIFEKHMYNKTRPYKHGEKII